MVTEKVALDWTAVTLIKLTPPWPGVKKLLVTAVSEPFMATETVCEATDPPEVALNWRDAGVAVIPLLLPAIVNVTFTLTEPKTVFNVSVPV